MMLIEFQRLVRTWCIACFGETVTVNPELRNYRFIEEALELVQACGCSKEDVLELVEYVFSRPDGDIKQEIGGVMVTLAALANAQHIDIRQCAGDELKRCWINIDKIRDKQQSKKGTGPLPC